MATKGAQAFRIGYSVLVIFIFILIASIGFFNFGKAGYNRDALVVYTTGAGLGIVMSSFFVLMNVFKKVPFPLNVGHIAEDAPAGISIGLQFGIPILFAVIIGAMQFGGFQVWGEPNVYNSISAFASSEETSALQEFGIGKSIYDVGIVPAFVEDMAAFSLSAAIVAFELLLVSIAYFTTKNKFFSPLKNPLWYYASFIIASPIAALFFSRAHEVVAGQDILFFLVAWIFQTINLYIYWFTGIFFPIAHFVHNSLYVLGFAVALSITLASFHWLAIIRKQKGDPNARSKSKNNSGNKHDYIAACRPFYFLYRDWRACAGACTGFWRGCMARFRRLSELGSIHFFHKGKGKSVLSNICDNHYIDTGKLDFKAGNNILHTPARNNIHAVRVHIS